MKPAELHRACRLTPYARAEYMAADLDDPSIDDLERARRFFVRATQGWARMVAGTPTGWSTSIHQHSNRANFIVSLVERLPACAERLRRVAIECRPALEVIEAYGATDAVIYADPPYLHTTRSSQRKRTLDYQHDFGTEEEHRALAEALNTTPSTVFLSGYASPLYGELYDGWWTIERNVVNTSSTGVAGRSRATEVIWSNRPIAAQLDLIGSHADRCAAP